MISPHRISFVLTLSLMACGGGPEGSDAGRTDAPRSDGGASDGGGSDVPVVGPAIGYVEENATIVSGGMTRTYLLVRPDDDALAELSDLPLVIGFHGDGGNGAAEHAGFPFEDHFAGGVIAAYPDAPGGTFPYYEDAGRTREATLVTDLIAALSADLPIDTGRVFLTGFSGGATLINALGCRLGDGVIRGMGVHSGTLYPVDPPDFGYTGEGGVDCALPDTIFAWGTADATDVGFAQGENVRDNYLRTAGCDDTEAPWSVSPCVTYGGCDESVVWCPIAGMGHAVWDGATAAFTAYFQTLE